MLSSLLVRLGVPHQLRFGSALKTDMRELRGSNTGRAFWASRSEFSMAFSETHVNTG